MQKSILGQIRVNMWLKVTLSLVSFFLGLRLDPKEIDNGIVWKYLQRASLKFPLGLQISYLTEIGFSLNEIKSLILTEKPVKMSSKDLPYTHANYVCMMKEKLQELKEIHPDKNAQEMMKLLSSFRFQPEKYEKIKKEMENTWTIEWLWFYNIPGIYILHFLT